MMKTEKCFFAFLAPIAQQNLKIMQSFCSEFGLTPASRARLYAGGGEKGDSDDPMENVLRGGWQDAQ